MGYENLWAEKNNDGFYTIKSIPYFIYDVSVEDAVKVADGETEGALIFLETISHSIHSTIRVRPSNFALSDPQGDSLLAKLRSFGVDLEILPPHLITVDRSDCDHIDPVTHFLTENSIP